MAKLGKRFWLTVGIVTTLSLYIGGFLTRRSEPCPGWTNTESAGCVQHTRVNDAPVRLLSDGGVLSEFLLTVLVAAVIFAGLASILNLMRSARISPDRGVIS